MLESRIWSDKFIIWQNTAESALAAGWWYTACSEHTARAVITPPALSNNYLSVCPSLIIYSVTELLFTIAVRIEIKSHAHAQNATAAEVILLKNCKIIKIHPINLFSSQDLLLLFITPAAFFSGGN